MNTVRKKPKNPALWRTEKFISWPYSMLNPVVRLPRASATPESKTIPYTGDDEETFALCLAYRNQRGVEIWGKKRWDEILQVRARSVAREREDRPFNGVTLSSRGDWRGWCAYWYERQPDGSTRRRSKSFGFGTEKTRYQTSDEAFQAALDLRKRMEEKHYSAASKGETRYIITLGD